MANATLGILPGSVLEYEYISGSLYATFNVMVSITTNASGSGQASGRLTINCGGEIVTVNNLVQNLSPSKTYSLYSQMFRVKVANDGDSLTTDVTITASYATGVSGIGTISATNYRDTHNPLKPSVMTVSPSTLNFNTGTIWTITGNNLIISSSLPNGAGRYRLLLKDNRNGSWTTIQDNITSKSLEDGINIDDFDKQMVAVYAPTSPMKATFKLQTYDIRIANSLTSTNFVGETTKTVNVTRHSSMKPVVTLSFYDTNSTVRSHFNGAFVQNKSIVRTTVTTDLSYQAPISSGSLTINNQTFNITSTSQQFTNSKAIRDSGNLNITASVTDTRGATGTGSSTLVVVPYSEPKVTQFSPFRSTSTGTASSTGEYITVNYTVEISGINNINSASVKLLATGQTTQTATVIYDSTVDKKIATGSWTFQYDTESSCDVTIKATDYFTTVTDKRIVPSIFVLLDFYGIGTNTYNTGLAIGKVAESANLVDVNMVAEFRKGIRSTNGWINLRDDQNAGYETVFFRNPEYDNCYIRSYNAGSGGSIMMLRPGGTFIAGAGEYASNRYSIRETISDKTNTLGAESSYIGADGSVFIESNADKIVSENPDVRYIWQFSSSGNLVTPGNISMPSGSSITGVTSVGGYTIANFVRAYNSSIVNDAYVGASIDQTASNASRLVIRVSTTQSSVERDYALLVRDGYMGVYDYKSEAYDAYYYPNTMYYQAQASAASTSLTAGTPTKITMTSNISGNLTSTHYTIASGGVKVLTAGRYRVTGSVYINTASGQTSKSVYIYAGSSTTMSSNSIVNEVLYAGASSGAVSIAPKIIALDANDIVFLAARSNGANSTASKHDATYLLIEKIS